MSGGEVAAEAFLTAEVPVLAFPLFQGVLSWLVSDLGGALQTVLINNATGIVLTLQTNAEQSDIVAAATALKLAQASGDAAAIQGALTNAISAYKALINFDGVMPSLGS